MSEGGARRLHLPTFVPGLGGGATYGLNDGLCFSTDLFADLGTRDLDIGRVYLSLTIAASKEIQRRYGTLPF